MRIQRDGSTQSGRGQEQNERARTDNSNNGVMAFPRGRTTHADLRLQCDPRAWIATETKLDACGPPSTHI
eukprot:5244720-Lingulodinium_polyedra.AAC.1